jgi:DNA-directed RNA polymerase specialized sigma24 family protein
VTRPSARNPLAGLDVNELLAMARHADRQAFGELFRRYRRYAEAVARSSGARDVDEAVAESFRLVVSAIDAGNGPTIAFGPYLATTVRSVARRQRHLAARHDIVEPTVFEARVVDEGDATGDPVLATAFASLPERWQSVIWYVDIEGIPPRQVVDLVGVPSSNAASALLLRARAGLRVAYLEALVGGAHTPEVRAHLAGLVAGAATTDELETAAQWHLERCPECRDLAARVAAVVARGSSRQLAVAVVALMGFAPRADLIPSGALAGLGFGGLPSLAGIQPGWLTAAATTAVVGGVLTVAALVGGGDEAAGNDGAGFPAVETVSSLPDEADAVTAPRRSTPSSPTPTTVATTSTTTSTTSSTSVPATAAPTSTAVANPPPTTGTPPAPPTIATPPPAETVPVTQAPPPVDTPTSVPDTTTSTLPPESTTTTTSTPTTTSTTVAPEQPVGSLGGGWTVVNENVLHLDLVVEQLTGEAGRVVFSAPMTFSSVSGATCPAPTECTFAGVASPATISIAADTDATTITIQLLDSKGTVDDTAEAG